LRHFCSILMPSGHKPGSPAGFDRVQTELIAPAGADAGYSARRPRFGVRNLLPIREDRERRESAPGSDRMKLFSCHCRPVNPGSGFSRRAARRPEE
jgi:hypothetical protein